MKKYQYLYLEKPSSEKLNELGAKGWYLAAIEPHVHIMDTMYVMCREVIEDETCPKCGLPKRSPGNGVVTQLCICGG